MIAELKPSKPQTAVSLPVLPPDAAAATTTIPSTPAQEHGGKGKKATKAKATKAAKAEHSSDHHAEGKKLDKIKAQAQAQIAPEDAVEATPPPAGSGPRPLLDLIRETGFSKYRLALEAGVAYPTLNHITNGTTNRPLEDTAVALLTVLNHYRGGGNGSSQSSSLLSESDDDSSRDRDLESGRNDQSQPLAPIRLEDVKEFKHLRTRYTSATPNPHPLMLEGKQADTTTPVAEVIDTNDGKAVESAVHLPLQQLLTSEPPTPNHPRPRRKGRRPERGRPPGSGVKRPGATGLEPLSGVEQFVRELLAPTAFTGQNKGNGTGTGRPTRAAQLLNMVADQLNAQTNLNENGFSLRATQVALADPSLSTSVGRVEIQVLPEPDKTNTTTSLGAGSEAEAVGKVVHISVLKATGEGTGPTKVDLTLSWQEFEQLSLLQLYLIKQSQQQ